MKKHGKKFRNKLVKKIIVSDKQTKEPERKFDNRVDELNHKIRNTVFADPKSYRAIEYDNWDNLTREEKIINKVCAILTRATFMCSSNEQPLFWAARGIFLKYLRDKDMKRIVQTRYDNYKKLYQEYLERNNDKDEEKRIKVHFGRKKIRFENPEKHLSKKKVLSEIERIASEM